MFSNFCKIDLLFGEIQPGSKNESAGEHNEQLSEIEFSGSSRPPARRNFDDERSSQKTHKKQQNNLEGRVGGGCSCFADLQVQVGGRVGQLYTGRISGSYKNQKFVPFSIAPPPSRVEVGFPCLSKFRLYFVRYWFVEGATKLLQTCF